MLDQPGLSGGVKVVFQHAQFCAELGHSVTILAGAPQPDWALFRGEYVNYNATAPHLEDADTIIATYWTTIPLIQHLGFQPTIHFCQGYEGDLPHLQLAVQQIEALYCLPIPTFVVNPTLGTFLKRRFGRDSFVVSPPLDPLFRPVFLRCAPNRMPWVVIPGIFESEVKGIRTALRAVKRLREMGQACRVLRISTFPLSEEERQILEPDRYLCRASPQEVARNLRQCDLLMFPSLPPEGFGLPILEALISKVPVVASRIPAAEFIGAPILVPVGDVEAFASEARSLLSDPRRWRETRQVGYQMAQKFHPDVIKRQLAEGLQWAYARTH